MTKLTVQDATQVLAGLANEMRLEIFKTLVVKGGMPAGELADAIDVRPSTLSFHLKDLHHVRLVTRRKEGRQVIYAANFDVLNELLGYLVDDCCGGNPELCIRIATPTVANCSKPA